MAKPKTPVVAKTSRKLESDPPPALPPKLPGSKKPYSFWANLNALKPTPVTKLSDATSAVFFHEISLNLAESAGSVAPVILVCTRGTAKYARKAMSKAASSIHLYLSIPNTKTTTPSISHPLLEKVRNTAMVKTAKASTNLSAAPDFLPRMLPSKSETTSAR